jgi:hypothetical protein
MFAPTKTLSAVANALSGGAYSVTYVFAPIQRLQ